MTLGKFVRELKKQYPNPQTVIDGTSDPKGYSERYCVAGALCLSRGAPTHFPSRATIAFTLREINKKLSHDLALSFAAAITGANDRGNFKLAWQELDRAIRWRPSSKLNKGETS